MTFARWCLLTESVRCTLQCNNICGRIVESDCTLARRRAVWNREGVRPTVCDVLERIAVAADPAARVWRGSGHTHLPEVQQGVKVLGTPLGHPSFVEAHLLKLTEQRTFLERIPEVQDLQSAWSLLFHSASAKAQFG